MGKQRAAPTGQDAEFVVALPQPNGLFCPTMPFHHANLEMSVDGGSSYAHAEPAGGRPAVPNAKHRYTYVLRGGGDPAAFRLKDSFTRDNYGTLRIRIHRARDRDCAGLYAALGFSSQSACEAALPTHA
jgi:hypothetical protein